MIKINITDEQIAKAQKRFKFGALKNSITKGKSNIFGALGEVITIDYFKDKHTVEDSSTYDYDIIMDSLKVDVKTKKTTVVPKDHYLCSVSNANTRQQCDFYLFVRVTEDYKTGYILGYLNKQGFYEKGFFARKGEIDPGTPWKFKDDCYNIPISKLNSFREERGGV